MGMATRWMLSIALVWAGVASADTVEGDGVSLTGVYVNETDSFYYVANPEDGSVRVFPKRGTVVTPSEDRELILDAWKARRAAQEQPKAETTSSKRSLPRTPLLTAPKREEVPTIKGTATWEVRNNPRVDAMAYQEYLRNGYSPERDAARRQSAYFAIEPPPAPVQVYTPVYVPTPWIGSVVGRRLPHPPVLYSWGSGWYHGFPWRTTIRPLHSSGGIKNHISRGMDSGDEAATPEP